MRRYMIILLTTPGLYEQLVQEANYSIDNPSWEPTGFPDVHTQHGIVAVLTARSLTFNEADDAVKYAQSYIRNWVATADVME